MNTHIHIILLSVYNNNEKMVHKFEIEQGNVYERVWVEEREGGHDKRKKSFKRKAPIKAVMTTKPVLQEILRAMLHTE